MTMLGKCITKNHDQCEIKIQKWYHGFTGVGRKREPAIIYLDEYNECDCKCHKPKPVRRTRKKT